MTKSKEVFLSVKKHPFQNIKIKSSQMSADYARNFYHDDLVLYESFFLLMMDRANNTIAFAKISQGGVATTYVDAKIIAKYAVDCLASSCIIVHNHPSGNLNPSQPDKDITKKIKQGLAILDIVLLDSIILTEDSFFSFADEGLL